MKKKRSLLFLILLLIILIAAYLIIKKNDDEQTIVDSESDIKSISLIKNDATNLTKIEIKSSENLVLINDNTIWKIEGLEKMSMDQNNIISLTTSLSNMNAELLVFENASASDLKDYGFDNPKTSAAAFFNDDTKFICNVGKQNPSKSAYYVTINDSNNIYLVSSNSIGPLLIPKNNYIDLTINLPDLTHIKTLNLKVQGKNEITIIENPNLSEEALKEKLDTNTTYLLMTKPLINREVYPSYFESSIVTSLNSIYFHEVLEMNSENNSDIYGFDNPLISLEMTNTLDETFSFIVGNKIPDTNNYYFKSNNKEGIYAITKTSIEGFLNIEPINLVDKFVYRYDINDINQISIKNTDEQILIKLTPSKIKTESDTELNVLNATIDDIPIPEKQFRDLFKIIIAPYYDSMGNNNSVSNTPDIVFSFELLNGNKDIYEYYSINENFYIVKQNNDFKDILSKKHIKDVLTSIKSYRDELSKE